MVSQTSKTLSKTDVPRPETSSQTELLTISGPRHQEFGEFYVVREGLWGISKFTYCKRVGRAHTPYSRNVADSQI